MSVDRRHKTPLGKLNVVLFWHMHQPEYRDLSNGEFFQPWTYLHVIKDYVDMAAHLESNPQARAVVNFVPVLLEQIDAYRQQLEQYLQLAEPLRDPLLAALADPQSVPGDQQLEMIKACLRANEERMIQRYPAYVALADIANNLIEDPALLAYYDPMFLSDLLVWYHLAWMGETVRRDNPVISALIEKQRLFSADDRRDLLEVIHHLVATVLDRYRDLAQQKRIELSMTPYAHPITPLLIDFDSAKEAMPEVELPEASGYPGGEARSEWHLKHGIKTFERYFGIRPSGCWPAEGSVSEATVKQLDAAGFEWFASGETVLRNSLSRSHINHQGCLHCGYRLDNQHIAGFFRDDVISDHIGFQYSGWHADDAVANLVVTLQHIAEACADHPAPIVSIVLDGENAWEYYPENGYYFLTALYQQLSEHPDLNLTTYSDYLNQHHLTVELSNLVAGSWVYGTFSTWIGMKDKNRAWDMLVDAKLVYDRVLAEGHLSAEEIDQATIQLATCESSDWFWWFGDYNSADSVKAFDQQYRLHLRNLYRLLRQAVPDYLFHGFSSGSIHPSRSGVMLPGKQD